MASTELLADGSRVVRTATTLQDGTQTKTVLCFNRNGQLHSTNDEPASIYECTRTTRDNGQVLTATTTMRKSWYSEGALHKLDGPALTTKFTHERTQREVWHPASTQGEIVTEKWYAHGKIHRDQGEGPAVTETFTEKSSLRDGVDSEDEDDDGGDLVSDQHVTGEKRSFYFHGKLHREDGDKPARVSQQMWVNKTYGQGVWGKDVRFTVKHGFYHNGTPDAERPTEITMTASCTEDVIDSGIMQSGYDDRVACLVAAYEHIAETESLQRYCENVPVPDYYVPAFGTFDVEQKWLDEEGELHREGAPAQIHTGVTMIHDGQASWRRSRREYHFTHGARHQDGSLLVGRSHTRDFDFGFIGATHTINTYKHQMRGHIDVDVFRSEKMKCLSVVVDFVEDGHLHNLFGPARYMFEKLPLSMTESLADSPTPEGVIAMCLNAPGALCTSEWRVYGEECWCGPEDEWPDLVAQGRNLLVRRFARRWRRREQPPPANGLIVTDYPDGKLYMNFCDGRLHNTDKIPRAENCACAFIADGEEAPCEQWSYACGTIQGVTKAAVPLDDAHAAEAYTLKNERDWWGRYHGKSLSDVFRTKWYVHGLEVTEAVYKEWKSKWGDGRNNLKGLWPTPNKDRLLATLLRPTNSPYTSQGRKQIWRLYLDVLPEGADRPTYEEFVAALA